MSPSWGPRPRVAVLVAVSAVAAACERALPANGPVAAVHDVKTEEVPLQLEPGSPPAPPVPPPPLASSRSPTLERGYGYTFDEDPLLEGAACPRPCDACPAWSRCEIVDVLELNKNLFNPCWRHALGAPASVTFTARATVSQEGHVLEVAIERVTPDSRPLAACLTRAFEQIPFALEGPGTTTRLEVPVRILRPR